MLKSYIYITMYITKKLCQFFPISCIFNTEYENIFAICNFVTLNNIALGVFMFFFLLIKINKTKKHHILMYIMCFYYFDA